MSTGARMLRKLRKFVDGSTRCSATKPLKECQAEFERYLIVVPAMTWPEAAARARYLIQLLADVADAQDARRHELIASVLEDLERLSG
jgi:hypothetical protein